MWPVYEQKDVSLPNICQLEKASKQKGEHLFIDPMILEARFPQL